MLLIYFLVRFFVGVGGNRAITRAVLAIAMAPTFAVVEAIFAAGLPRGSEAFA